MISITLVTAILGFLTGTIPSVLRYFENKQRYKHEMQMAVLEAEAIIRNAEAAKKVAEYKAALDDVESARQGDTASGLMEVFRSSVRPIITYAFVGLFLFVKGMAIHVILEEGLSLQNIEVATSLILDETTITFTSLVMGFYFGSRLFVKEK